MYPVKAPRCEVGEFNQIYHARMDGMGRLPSGNHTCRAGKSTIQFADFPIETSIQFGGFPASHV